MTPLHTPYLTLPPLGCTRVSWVWNHRHRRTPRPLVTMVTAAAPRHRTLTRIAGTGVNTKTRLCRKSTHRRTGRCRDACSRAKPTAAKSTRTRLQRGPTRRMCTKITHRTTSTKICRWPAVLVVAATASTGQATNSTTLTSSRLTPTPTT